VVSGYGTGLAVAAGVVSSANALNETAAKAAARTTAPITGRLMRVNDFMMFIFVCLKDSPVWGAAGITPPGSETLNDFEIFRPTPDKIPFRPK
jgi:hypothetical protein